MRSPAPRAPLRPFISLLLSHVLVCGLAILVGLATWQPALAQDAGGPSYVLDTGDKLRVKVHEWPDMTGEYRVGSDRSISLPLIGEVPVSGLEPRQVAASIAKRLKEQAKLTDEPIATVEVVQYRPFFILGHVMKPGEYEFRPSVNVLQAVGMAGGFFRFMDPGLQRFDRDSIQARGDLRTLMLKADRLRAEAARIDAERTGVETIDFPEDLASNSSLKPVLDQERAILASHRQTVDQEVAAADNMNGLLEKEIASLEAQMAAESKQYDTVMEEMEGVRSLAAKGLSTSPRTYLLERTKAQIAGQKQAIETNIIRSRQNIGQTQQRLNQFRNDRMDKLNADKVRNQAEYDETQEKIQMMRKLILEAEVSAPAQIAQRYRQDRVKYTIVRRTKERSNELAAVETTLLEPGDVLKVEKQDDLPDVRTSSQAVIAP